MQIDPRPFQAALDQATASAARDQANLDNARKDLARYAQLLEKQFAPEQQYATQLAAVAADEATVRMDQANIDATKLNVEYASIRSPIEGVTGIRRVDLGNLVQANGAILVVLTQIKPIYIVATVPEADIPRIRAAMRQRRLEVDAFDANDTRQISQGRLDLVNNQVDETTGTVQLKAEFANADEALWPGEFINAHLVIETVTTASPCRQWRCRTGCMAPSSTWLRAAIPPSLRKVAVTQTENNIALIGSGLKAGELVVTAGQSQLAPGIKMKVKQTDGGAVAETATDPAAHAGVAMNISAPFIKRPIATVLLMAALLVGGVVGYNLLPVAPLPTVDLPTIVGFRDAARRRSGNHGGVGRAAARAAIRRPAQASIRSPRPACSAAPDHAAIRPLAQASMAPRADVLAAINAAQGYLPKNLPTPPTYRKVNPADHPVSFSA